MRAVQKVSFLFVGALLVGCGYSWPAYEGHVNTAELRQIEFEGRLDGSKRHQPHGDCWLERDANACQWLSAIWQADYEESAHLCATAPTQKIKLHQYDIRPDLPCERAASFALGCGITRGIHASGNPEYEQAEKDDAGPDCGIPEPFPQDLVTPPPVDVDKALQFLLTGCKQGEKEDCSTIMSVLLAGVIAGIPIPQDMELARKFYDRYMTLAYPNEDAQSRDEDWKDNWAKDELAETPEDRQERIKTVTEAYAKQAAFDANLSASVTSRVNEHSTWNAIAAGLSAGLATTASVDQSLGTAQSNINSTVAASQAANAHARLAQQQQQQQQADAHAAQQQAQQQQQLTQQQQMQAAADAQKKQQEASARASQLKKCLDVDQNCTYGTSNRCQPATAYGDHWAERRQYERAQTALKLCGSDQSFPRDCGQKVMQATPTRDQQQAIVDRIRDLGKRASALPASYNCPYDPNIDTYNGSSVDDYCNYARSFGVCMNLLVSDAAALESARKLDECVYYGTFQYSRDQLRAQHDADCHKQWDPPAGAGQ